MPRDGGIVSLALDGIPTHERRVYLALLVVIGAAFALRLWLATPFTDDGVIGSTILGKPYYSEYHRIYTPYYKPWVTLLMPARFLPYPASFAYATALQTLAFAASAWLTYLLARRYLSPRVAALAGIIAVYVLFLQETRPPTRPEPLLLLSLTSAAYLADTWRVTGKARYLAGAAAAAGVLALPMHTNASVVYIFLGIFALWHRRRMSGRERIVFAGSLAAASLAGLAVFAAPSPSAVIALFSEYAGDRGRYTFLLGEAERFAFLLRPAPMLSVALFFGAVALWALRRERRGAIGKGAEFARRYSTIAMLGLASFIGLALLPSGTWSMYLVYYLPALAVFAALAYERERPSRWAALGVGALMLAAIGVEWAVLSALRDPVEAWISAGLAVGAAAAMLFCAAWASGRREWLAAALVLLVALRLGLTAADHNAYNDVVAAARARAAEIGGGVVVAGPPMLAWAFARDDFHPIMHPWYEPALVREGVVAIHDYGNKQGWLAVLPEACVISGLEPVTMSSFVSNRLRGHERQWEVGVIACEAPDGGARSP